MVFQRVFYLSNHPFSAILTYLVGSIYSEKKVVDSVASVIVTSTVMSLITVLSLFILV